jgi:hypothetical protein
MMMKMMMVVVVSMEMMKMVPKPPRSEQLRGGSPSVSSPSKSLPEVRFRGFYASL